ncbi:Histone-lysine N-methyltransferase ASHR2 [Linum grandiflorum]
MWVGEGLKVEEIQGKGRGLVSSQPLKGGQIVLRDSPILLYSARPLNLQQQHSSSSSIVYCDKCFRKIQSPSAASPCPSCSHHHFCSSDCLSSASASTHSVWVCQSLARLRDCPALVLHQPLDRQVQARYLIAAYNLAIVNPSQFQVLLSLQATAQTHEKDDISSAAYFLHSLISSLCPQPLSQGLVFSLELTLSLLVRDKLNAFGLMEPLDSSSERSVRAYGIYPRASMFNHDCLPNACRFDYADTDQNSDTNTDIIVRMIHDVPQGREICLSYFPVNENYSSRQKRLLEDYGFACDCDRCKVEANWSDADQDEEDESEMNRSEVMDEDESMEEDEQDLASGDNEAGQDFPHAYFFVRYMCNIENCWGTLAPLPPTSDAGNPSNVMECNVCGDLKPDELLAA